MKHDFQTVATATAGVCAGLALIWLCAPDLLLALWGVAYSYPAGLVGRRGAALFAGIAVMLWQARQAVPSPARSAMAQGMIVGCVLLAVSGAVELCTGHAGPGILIAVAAEGAIAAAFLAIEIHARQRQSAAS